MQKKTFIVLLLIACFTVISVASIASAGTVDLPKTGQTTSYYAGDDGALQKGVAWPSPRFTSNSAGTLTDNLTGLMWTQNANLPSGNKSWAGALDHVAGMNAGIYQNFGYTDWRLPNINELESLINLGQGTINAWLTTQGFTNVPSGYGYYWTSTTNAYYPHWAWSVLIIGYGATSSGGKTISGSTLWPVRTGQSGTFDLPQTGQTKCYDTTGNEIPCAGTGQDGDIQAGVAWPSPRFTSNSAGTLADNLTGLMWTQNANLPGGNKSWAGALDYVAGMNAGIYQNFGYTDWRLPNRKELNGLVDYSRSNPPLQLDNPFINVQSGLYWSSTTGASNISSAWVVNMFFGDTGYRGKSDSFNLYVWPVRELEETTTAIELAYFTAEPGNSNVELVWNTESETDNAGFNIYRATSEDRKYIKINTALIPAQGSSTQGAIMNLLIRM